MRVDLGTSLGLQNQPSVRGNGQLSGPLNRNSFQNHPGMLHSNEHRSGPSSNFNLLRTMSPLTEFHQTLQAHQHRVALQHLHQQHLSAQHVGNSYGNYNPVDVAGWHLPSSHQQQNHQFIGNNSYGRGQNASNGGFYRSMQAHQIPSGPGVSTTSMMPPPAQKLHSLSQTQNLPKHESKKNRSNDSPTKKSGLQPPRKIPLKKASSSPPPNKSQVIVSPKKKFDVFRKNKEDKKLKSSSTPEKSKHEKENLLDSSLNSTKIPPNSIVGIKRARDNPSVQPVPNVEKSPKKSKGVSSLSICKYKKNRSELKQGGYIPTYNEVSTTLTKQPKSHASSAKESLKANLNSANKDADPSPEKASFMEASPESTSSVFHVLDRRINLDSFHKDASFYSLLRAWVQDDPYRQIPPDMDLDHFSNDCSEIPNRIVEHPQIKNTKIDVLKSIQEMNRRKLQRKKVSTESSKDLLKNVVEKAKMIRMEKRKSRNTAFIMLSPKLQNTKVEYFLKKISRDKSVNLKN